MTTLLWFRGKDLRISDHAPLVEALKRGPVIPLFVVDPFFFAPERAQELPHRMQFLLESLEALQANLESRGTELRLVRGKSIEVIPHLVRKWGVTRVSAHRWVEPFGRERDTRIAGALDVPFDLHEGEMLAAPGTLRTQAGKPYAVFSQFGRSFRKTIDVPRPLAAPKHIPSVTVEPVDNSCNIPRLEELGIKRNPGLVAGGERAARQRLDAFITERAAHYDEKRNLLSEEGTSRLSQDLKFGTLSVRTAWHAATDALSGTKAGMTFTNELLWREFSHSTLWDRPDLLTRTFKPKFQDFPWIDDEEKLRAWWEGKTGYPVVDAASRQLIASGFVHNRARMIAASFLTKHLLIHYRHGEAHYMKLLTDGDWAQNNAGWQWSAGCGSDAQPYFRVFNPTLQGKRFDPQGHYVRRWVPELADLPTKYIHEPWTAPASVLKEANIALGQTYPEPIVDHKTARQYFLATAKSFLK